MSLDIPAYVTAPAHVANGVSVKAGTNWDLSRSAVATPIVPLADPEPVRPAVTAPATVYFPSEAPTGPAAAVAVFMTGQVVPDMQARAALRKLEKGLPYVVIGHADRNEKHPELLARRRANAIAAQLKRQGYKVTSVRSFGARRPLPDGNGARVDVFVQE